MIYRFLFIALLFYSCSDKNYFSNKEFSDIYHKTIKDGKYLMFFISGDNKCYPCNELIDDLRKNNVFSKHKNRYNFYRCNVNDSSNNYIQKIFLPEAVPNMYILSNEGNIIAYECGYVNAKTVNNVIMEINAGKYKMRQINKQFASTPDKIAEIQTHLLKATILQISNNHVDDILFHINKSIDIEPTFYSLYLKGKLENNDSLINLSKQYIKGTYQKIVFSDIINNIKSSSGETNIAKLFIENRDNLVFDKNGELTITIINRGLNPLVIYDIQTSCNCVKFEWSKRAIMLNKKIEIKVKITNEISDKIIYVSSNAINSIEAIHIKGDSQP